MKKINLIYILVKNLVKVLEAISAGKADELKGGLDSAFCLPSSTLFEAKGAEHLMPSVPGAPAALEEPHYSFAREEYSPAVDFLILADKVRVRVRVRVRSEGE